MKKFLVTIVAFLYLASTTGATVHLHFCMGKLVERSFVHTEEDACSKCGMDKSGQSKNGCCKDEQAQVKIENDHFKSTTSFKALQLAEVILPHSFTGFTPVSFSSITEEHPVSKAPPRTGEIAIYKRICVFRI